jgi:hypothetical protein
MDKKGDADTLATVKNAILVLIVLAVVIAVFYILTKAPIEGLKKIGDDTSGQTDDTLSGLDKIFGGCGKEGETKCSFEKKYICQNSKWVSNGDCPTK